jgi:hypothetical protein
MAEFVVKTTSFLAKMSASPNLPILSPLKLEMQAAKVDLHQLGDRPALGSAEYRFLFQVLYWFAYMDTDEKEPLFTFDARVLPLKEVLSCCARLSSQNKAFPPLYCHLNRLIAKHCPEIPLQTRRWELVKQVKVDFSQNYQEDSNPRKLKKLLSESLKSALAIPSDTSGLLAERSFILARARLSDSELITTTVGLLLSRPHSPLILFYSMWYVNVIILVGRAVLVSWCKFIGCLVLTGLFFSYPAIAIRCCY